MVANLRTSLVLAVSILIAAASAGPSLGEDLLAEIGKEIAKTLPPCDGKIAYEPGFLTRKDVNADGVEDIAIDYSNATCDESYGHWCGSSGCPFYAFTMRDGAYVEILQAFAQNVRFSNTKAGPVAILTAHPTNCPDGRIPCEMSYRWDGRQFTEAQAPTSVRTSQAGSTQPWIGKWGMDAGACKSADGLTIKITRKLLDLSAFESDCAIRKVDFDGSKGRIHATCSGEEGRAKKTLNFSINDNQLKFTKVDFNPNEFVRCQN